MPSPYQPEADAAMWRVALTVERAGAGPRRVEVTAPGDTAAGDVLDALAEHVGIRDARGSVFGESTLSRQWVDRSAPLRTSGLLRGDHLRLSVGFSSGQTESRLNRWRMATGLPNATGRVSLNRPPRLPRPEPLAQVAIPEAPTPPVSRRFPVSAVVVPVLLGLVLFAIIGQPAVALFAVLSPAMLVWNRIEDKRSGRVAHAEALVDHAQQTRDAVAALSAGADSWEARERASFPSPAETADAVVALSPRVWGRRPTDDDFLSVRLGVATRRAPIAVRGSSVASATLDQSMTRSDVPVAARLAEAGVLSIVGAGPDLDALVRWLVCQLSALHSPRDVRIAGVFDESMLAEWPTWLPHAADNLLDTQAVVFGPRQARTLLAAVTRIVDDRVGRRTSDDRTPLQPAVVVFLDARADIDPAACTTLLEQGPTVGVHTVWCGADERQLPGKTMLAVSVAAGTLTDLRNGEVGTFQPDALDAAGLDMAARLLAPLVDATDGAHRTSLPDRVLLDDLEPDLGSPAARRRVWDAAEDDTLRALLGVAADGPFELDFGPQGAHVLVGGTTGSGKSELLQTMVTSLAARYAPDRVSFLLVDYKGGTAFKDAVRFPHTVGLVTDLDEHLAHRALVALDAEIKRREEMLRAAGARSLWEMRRAGKGPTPPELLIVIDEFATLAEEVPEFVKGVVDIAARGRALGLRLVLATQRPAGVINDQIRANVATRIALRVNDDADSRDVIGSRDAAAIPQALPGRAIARVGRELIEFQSAFVGAPPAGHVDNAVRVRDLLTSDATGREHATAGGTLLEAVVEAGNKVMQLGHWPRPVSPWLPPLAAVIPLSDLTEEMRAAPPGSVALARTDEPSKQRQRVLAVDFDHHQNLLVHGTTRSGKTTLLRTIAAGVLAGRWPGGAQLFALDFGGHGLQSLADAPQCGAVVGPDDPGRVARVLRHLRREVDTRKRDMVAAGMTSYAQTLAAPAGALPRIVVLIDAYASFASVFERVDGGRLVDLLHRLVADGPSAGVHFVITADRRAAVPGALASIIPTRVVLRMAERDDYALLGVDPALARGATLVPGRGYVQGTVEVQIATVSADASAAAQSERLTVLGQVPTTTAPARRIGSLPAAIDAATLLDTGDGLAVPVGLTDDLDTWVADLRHGHLLVAGPPRSGRSSALGVIAASLSTRGGIDRVLVAPRRSPLRAMGGWSATIDADDAARTFTELMTLYEEPLAAGRPLVVICDDADELPESLSQALETLARRGRDVPVRFVVAAESRAALRTYSGLIPEVRKAKNGFLLTPDLDIDGELLGVRLRAPIEPTQVPGRGFGVAGGLAQLVQLARPPGPSFSAS